MSPTPDLSDVPRIWLGPVAGAQTRLFRKVVDTPRAPRAVRLELFAEMVYHLWVNGRHVQRGPHLHHPHRRPVASFDLLPLWRAGRNVLAVLVHSRGMATHNSIPTGEPGLVARLRIEDDGGATVEHVTDRTWRATARTGWRDDAPRRCWALGRVEVFDAAAAPQGWQGLAFDDAGWSAAEEHRPPTRIAAAAWIDTGRPLLREAWAPVRRVAGFAQVPAGDHVLRESDGAADFAAYLLAGPWAAPREVRLAGGLDAEGGGLAVEGLRPGLAAAVWADLGAEHVGQILLECDCPTAGVMDVGWGERLLPDGRPDFIHKGVSYADRVLARPGRVLWEPIAFTGARYLAVVLRGFRGEVRLRRWGMRSTEPDLSWAGRFDCDDDRLRRIWALCERSCRVGTQEGLMDCPTREQAEYVGDGHPVARWIAMLTGDLSYWRYLVAESFARQTRGGLVRSTLFTGRRGSLIDYDLLAVIGTRDYLARSGDAATARGVLPALRRVLDWFRARRDDTGLLRIGAETLDYTSSQEDLYDPAGLDEPWGTALFIDHAGMGWHNVGDPPIDRRGTNAAINALFVVSLRALAEIEDALGAGGAEALRAEADRTAAAAAKAFYDEKRGVFVDGVLDGERLAQVSQQTNTWCLWAGLCPRPRRRAVLERILRDDDRTMARSGPYFWSYMLPILAAEGMHREALEHIRRLWGPMLDAGATTLWETFAGDEKDTWCHPWSAAPVEFLLSDVAGLAPLALRGPRGVLRPRPDLLARADARLMLPRGAVEIGWERASTGRAELRGRLPEGLEAEVLDPAGRVVGTVRDRWALAVDLA